MTARSALLFLLLLAAALRVAGLTHSLPYKYVADTHVVVGALGMAQDRDLAPPPKKYTTYPYLLPYLLLPQFAALYAGGRATGAYPDAASFAAAVTDDPTPLYLLARTTITLFGLLAVFAIYRLGRRMLGRREAWIAGYLVATSLMLLHLGKDVRPWVAIAALVALTAERAFAFVEAPTLRRALVMGLCAGLSAACHQAGAIAALVPLAAGIALWVRDRGALGTALRGGIVAALAFGGAALLLGYPYLLRGHRADVAVSDDVTASQVDLGGQSLRPDAIGLSRFAETASGFLGFEPALVLLALLALVHYRHLGFQRGSAPLVWLLPLATFGFFLFYGGTHVRYLSPAIPLLALPAAAVARRLLDGGAVAKLAAIVLLALPLVQALRLDFVMSREDTRTSFLREVAAQVPEGSTIAVEGYGPPLRFAPAAIERLHRHDQWADRSEQREADGLAPLTADRPPYDVIPLERFYEFQSAWPHQWLARGDEPAAPIEKPIETFLDEERAQYLVAVDRWPGGARNSALDEVLARRGRLLAAELPHGEAASLEALLPMDPEFAATAIWKVHRPGPALRLYRVGPSTPAR
jgi:hypothetical protein